MNKASSSLRPTQQTYDEMQQAFDWFNERLFEGKLPSCMITLQRNKRTMGYFSQDRFVDQSGRKADEIAMNPEYFAIQPVQEVLSTLVHEMAHQWQQHHGQPGRGKYHNQEWANKMMAIGLCPSSTGKPGGRQTGDQMDHYIVPNGVFVRCCHALLDTQFRISWYDRYPAVVAHSSWVSENLLEAANSSVVDAEVAENPYEAIPAKTNASLSLVVKPDNGSNRLKYVCPSCSAQAWGKPKLHLLCGDCDMSRMHAEA